jgi:uncharacterized protein
VGSTVEAIMLKRVVPIHTKQDDPPATFTGWASTYGNTDLAGDVVEPGAFAKTLRELGGRVPVLWQHKQAEPIGVGELRDTSTGLMIHGRLTLGVRRADEAHALLKAGALRGLSIGYEVVSDYVKDGVRRLREIRLWEVSVVTIPANPLATVGDVKRGGAPFSDPLARGLSEFYEYMAAECRRMRLR